MDRREQVSKALAHCIARLDRVLQPWGFIFTDDGCSGSHTGPYASGHYVRDNTRIGLSCRETIDNILYEHSFITLHPSWRAIERYTLGHAGLMRAIGHSDDCLLVGSDDIPDAVIARDGGNRLNALIHDLTLFVAPILREPTDTFFAILRQGYRSYTVG